MSRRGRVALVAMTAFVGAFALVRALAPTTRLAAQYVVAARHDDRSEPLLDDAIDTARATAPAPPTRHDEARPVELLTQRHALPTPGPIACEARLDRTRSASGATVTLDVCRVLEEPGDLGTNSSPTAEAFRPVAHHTLPPDATIANLELEPGDWIVTSGKGLHVLTLEVGVELLSRGFVDLPIDATLPLRGRVLDAENGAAIAGASITCTSRPPGVPEGLQSFLRDRRVLADATTHSRPDGAFEIPCCTEEAIELDVVAPGYCSAACVDVVSNGQPLSIALVPGIPACGRVLDEEGRPIAGAELTVGRLGAIPVEGQVVASTDANGSFASSDFPRARVAVIARADGFAPARVEVDLAAGPPTDLELILAHETPLHGIVVDDAGVPVGRARLLVGSLTDHLVIGTLETDENGAFTMPWTRRDHRYHVQVECDGFDVVDVGPVVVCNEPLRIELPRRGTIELLVRDDQQRAIGSFRVARAPEVVVEAHDEYWWSQAEWTEVTDSGGRHRLAGLRRRPHRVLVEAPGFLSSVLRALPSAPDARSSPLTVTLARGLRFGATLVDEQGRPIADAAVRFAARASFGTRRPLPGAAVHTDAAGGFSLLVAGDAPFDLVATRAGFAPATFDRIDPRVARPTLKWPQSGAITGRVRTSDRTLLASICLRAESEEGGAYSETRPGRDGSFRFEALPTGSVRIQLLDEWASTTWHTFTSREQRVDVTPDGMTDVDFDLTAGCTIEGMVALPASLAAERFEVVALPGAGSRSGESVHSTVELDGRFVLCNLAEGPWTLLARARSPGLLALARVEIVVDGDAPPPPLLLAVSEPTLSLQLVAAESGQPLQHGWLELHGAFPRLLVEVGAEGSVRCAGLDAAGLVDCDARAPGRARTAVDWTPSAAPRIVELAREARLELEIVAPGAFVWRDTVATVETAHGAEISQPAAGHLAFSELPAGPFRVRVRGPRTAASYAGALAGGERRSLRLELDAPARLDVTVVDRRGVPAPHTTVTVRIPASGDDAAPLHGETDGSGVVRFEVAAGDCEVTCGATTLHVAIAPGGVAPVTLRLH